MHFYSKYTPVYKSTIQTQPHIDHVAKPQNTDRTRFYKTAWGASHCYRGVSTVTRQTKIKWNRERWGGRTRQKSICKGMCAGNPDQRAGLGSLHSNRQHHRAFNDKFFHPPCNLVYKNGWGLFSFFPCQWDMQTFSQRRSSQKKRREKKESENANPAMETHVQLK